MSFQRRFVCLALPLALFAAGRLYRSATVAADGELYIVLDSGQEVRAPKMPGQSGFDSVAVSQDRRTVGGLVLYTDPTNSRGAPLTGKLVLYRAGAVLHQFSTLQVFWDWQFQDDGKHVAYSSGPTHGGAAECVLRDVESGKVIDTWDVKGGKDAPFWASALRV